MWCCHTSFFFFQAEDGIRDVAVTGVQTCALPIYVRRRTDPIKKCSAQKPAKQGLFPCVTIHFGDGFGERNVFRAGLYAILRVGAFLHAARTHQRFQAFALVHCAGGVDVEEAHLADDGRADELVVLVHLRANFEAVAAGDAARKRVAFRLNLRRNRSEEHTSELQSRLHLVCRLLLEKKKQTSTMPYTTASPAVTTTTSTNQFISSCMTACTPTFTPSLSASSATLYSSTIPTPMLLAP